MRIITVVCPQFYMEHEDASKRLLCDVSEYKDKVRKIFRRRLYASYCFKVITV